MSTVRLIQVLLILVLTPLLFSCAGTAKVKPNLVTAVYGFDGTGQNIKHGKKTNVYHFLKAHRTSDRSVTNIYASGVGSLKPGKAHILNLPGKLTGLGGRKLVEQMYAQLVGNFKKGHKGIVIVGFSRGAALSREFAHVIAERGNPIYYKEGQKPQGKAPAIMFMGLFDTVYSFGTPFGKNDIAYRKTIPSNVKAVAHATAKLEKRNTFDLWSIHSQEKYLNRTTGSVADGNYRAEKQFNGGHDDVGGAQEANYNGYEPLKWVIEEGEKAGVLLEVPDKELFGKKVQPEGNGIGKRQVYFPGRKESKVTAITLGKAKNGCQGRQIYLSGGSCYSCPDGYRRTSRKMTHPKACNKRGSSTQTVGATYEWELNGCRKGQFKHQGRCKQCPEGTKREHVLGMDTGYCTRL